MVIDRKFTWKEFDQAVDQIAWQLAAGGLLPKFKLIYGIPRGGLILAVALSHKLDKPIVLDPECVNTPGIQNQLLVVDDISDSGKTLSKIQPKLSATIHYNPRSSFRPLAWVLTKEPDEWIVYPWERKGF